jgi:ribose/xylose/arabinose/galactoside ABC-type transport system permease subunit
MVAILAFGRAFFSAETLHDIILAMLPLGILVCGQLLVLLLGQIDLSMTAVMATGSIVSASLMTRAGSHWGEPWTTTAGICACLAVGALVGMFNGVCTALLRIPSFIVTLAAMMACGGAAVWYASSASDTISIGGLPADFRYLGYGTVAHLPIALIVSLIVLALVHFVLMRTMTGRQFYAMGHNLEAARIAGVPVQKLTVAAFTASGVCAGLAGVIYTSRIETGLPTLGNNMLLDIVGAAIIGGVSLFGGRGSTWMVLGGVAFLSVLDKSLQLMGLSLFIVLAIKGSAILVAAMADVVRLRRVNR